MGVAEDDRGLRGLRAALAVIALAGGLVSAYLTWAHLSGAVPVCVGGAGGCETVQTSRYSEIVGVPVAALGLVAYAAMLACAVLRDGRAAVLGVFVALVGVLFSAYLTYLELFVIRAICQWCVASAGLVVAYLVLAAVRLRFTGSGVPETAGGE
jgi:uncharacterized membrane protein